jgi:hypothetical protein
MHDKDGESQDMKRGWEDLQGWRMAGYERKMIKWRLDRDGKVQDMKGGGGWKIGRRPGYEKGNGGYSLHRDGKDQDMNGGCKTESRRGQKSPDMKGEKEWDG